MQQIAFYNRKYTQATADASGTDGMSRLKPACMPFIFVSHLAWTSSDGECGTSFSAPEPPVLDGEELP